jgi:hypothetical protein
MSINKQEESQSETEGMTDRQKRPEGKQGIIKDDIRVKGGIMDPRYTQRKKFQGESTL